MVLVSQQAAVAVGTTRHGGRAWEVRGGSGGRCLASPLHSRSTGAVSGGHSLCGRATHGVNCGCDGSRDGGSDRGFKGADLEGRGGCRGGACSCRPLHLKPKGCQSGRHFPGCRGVLKRKLELPLASCSRWSVSDRPRGCGVGAAYGCHRHRPWTKQLGLGAQITGIQWKGERRDGDNTDTAIDLRALAAWQNMFPCTHRLHRGGGAGERISLGGSAWHPCSQPVTKESSPGLLHWQVHPRWVRPRQARLQRGATPPEALGPHAAAACGDR